MTVKKKNIKKGKHVYFDLVSNEGTHSPYIFGTFSIPLKELKNVSVNAICEHIIKYKLNYFDVDFSSPSTNIKIIELFNYKVRHTGIHMRIKNYWDVAIEHTYIVNNIRVF